MLPAEILQLRLANQHLAQSTLTDPTQLVAHLGAVQSQDYPAAVFAIGQRLTSATERAVERAFDSGAFVRTHILRPTWHFVAACDLRWMLTLTAPRIRAMLARALQPSGLDEAVLARANEVIA